MAVVPVDESVLRERLVSAIRSPGSAISFVLAILRGHWYRALFWVLRRRFRAGSRLRVFGRLSVRGPGEVVLGENVALWGRVNLWTYAPKARIVVGRDVMMSGTRLSCAERIEVGDLAILADASIRDTDFHSTRADRRSPDAPIRVAPVVVGRNVWVGAGAVLLAGTSIGENSVVSAAAVCMRAYPENKVILGNPAKVAMPIPAMPSDTSHSHADSPAYAFEDSIA
jgi:acetyltransferase-like isoleucine patch superfamily enzyme